MESTERIDKTQTIEEVESDVAIKKEEIAPYEKKYFALLQKCEIVKQTNERLVNRIYYVKKLLRRRKKERKFLMDRLDSYGDDYRNIAETLFSEMIGDTSPTPHGRTGEAGDWSVTNPQSSTRKDGSS